MEAWERILYVINNEGYNKNSFSSELGLSSNTTIGRIVNEHRTPSKSTIDKIVARFPKYNRDWLITGKGEMLKPLQHGNGINNSFDGTYYGGKFAGRDIIDSSNNSGNVADSSYNNNTMSSESINETRLLAEIEILKSKIESMKIIIDNKERIIDEKERLIKAYERMIDKHV